MTTARQIYIIHGLHDLNDILVFINILNFIKPSYIISEKNDRGFIKHILDKQVKEIRPKLIELGDIKSDDSLVIYTFSKTLNQFSSVMQSIKKLWISDNKNNHAITLTIWYFSVLYEKFVANKSNVYFKFLQDKFEKISNDTFTLKRDVANSNEMNDFDTLFGSSLMMN